MSRIGNPYDNAKAESFMKTLKQEEVDGGSYRDLKQARDAIGTFIEEVYNRQRLHSALAYRPPAGSKRSYRPLPPQRRWRPRCPARSGTALIARIAKCLNARLASRTTASPRGGKSLTPTSRLNQGHPSDQGLLTISQKCVTHVSERAQYARSNNAVANCNLFLVFVFTRRVRPKSLLPVFFFLSVICFYLSHCSLRGSPFVFNRLPVFLEKTPCFRQKNREKADVFDLFGVLANPPVAAVRPGKLMSSLPASAEFQSPKARDPLPVSQLGEN
jgi:hypothetical protein